MRYHEPLAENHPQIDRRELFLGHPHSFRVIRPVGNDYGTELDPLISTSSCHQRPTYTARSARNDHCRLLHIPDSDHHPDIW